MVTPKERGSESQGNSDSNANGGDIFSGAGNVMPDLSSTRRSEEPWPGAVMSPLLRATCRVPSPTNDESVNASSELLGSLAVASVKPSVNQPLGPEANAIFQLESPHLYTMLANEILKEGKYYLCVSEAVRNAVESSRNLDHSVTIEVLPYKNSSGKFLGIRVRDNGCGMTSDEMSQYLIKAGQSGKSTGIQGHFGYGMKIVAGYVNERVEITSWKNGSAHRVIYGVVDPSTNSRGPIRQPYRGSQAYVVPCEMPEGANAESGTQVDLLGGIKKYYPQQISSFLSQRFLSFNLSLEGVRKDSLVRVWSDTAKGRSTLVKGVLQTLSEGAQDYQAIEGTHACYHWVIEKEKRNPLDLSTQEMVSRSNTPRIFYGWREEAYHHGVQSTLANEWGITHGADRFKLVVEFKGDITPNPVRTRLDAFKQLRTIAREEWLRLMPPEVKQYIENRRATSKTEVVRAKTTAAIISNWHGEETASISVAVLKDPSHINPANSRVGMSPPGGRRSGIGRGANVGSKGPSSTGRGGAAVANNPAGTGNHRGPTRLAKEVQIPLVEVSFDPDLGSEPFQYLCTPQDNEHRLMINPQLTPIKRLLEEANTRSDATLKEIRQLIAVELQMRIDHFIQETQQLPSSDIVLAFVTTMVLPNIALRDADAIRVPKRARRAVQE